MIAVAKRIGRTTSCVAPSITSPIGKAPLELGSLCRCRSRRTMFSTAMMASSTSAPIAIVNPPRVIVLTVAPKAEIASTPATSDSGIASAEITVARMLPRKKNRMMITSTAPSRMATETL